MLRIFRRIRQRLLSTNKAQSYFLYAIGEILLVVLGILIALQINNWNELKKSKVLERELLEQFRADLRADISSVKQVNYWYGQAGNACEILIKHMKERLPYHDSLALYFDLWVDFESFSLNSGAISNLNSRGVEMVRNTDLRNKILKLYNKTYEYEIKSNQFFREDHVAFTYKIHLDRIEPIEWRVRAIPNDYEALWDDQVFINHLQWIRNAATFNFQGNEALMEEIQALIHDIELDLGLIEQ